jgi:hypothetical protein
MTSRPTHHCTGPAQKAVQSGEFKRRALMSFATAPVVRYTSLAVALASTSTSAFANAFIPTMISANVVWLFVLAPIVAIEGWLMARWEWERPYKSALNGNLVSMLAALPFGVLLSMAGGYLVNLRQARLDTIFV